MATTSELNYVIGALTAERSEQYSGSGQAPFNTAIAIVTELRDSGEITALNKSFVLWLLTREKNGEYADNADRRSFVNSIAIIETVVPTDYAEGATPSDGPGTGGVTA